MGFSRYRGFVAFGVRAALLAAAMTGAVAEAGVVMYGTRIVYPADQSQVTVRLANQDKSPNLVQVWVDTGNGEPPRDSKAAPFVVMPPLFRIGAEGQQSVRIMFGGAAALPTDRESLFWFNFLQIPPEGKSDQQEGTAQIAISFLNQVKLLYRPPTIDGDVRELARRLAFSVARSGKTWHLTARNPTGFYATFVDKAGVKSGTDRLPVDFHGEVTLAPFSSLSWKLAGESAQLVSPVVEFSLIDDAGNPRPAQGAAVTAP
ncbi:MULTISPECIES: molecular chaperone [unclassified Burkholderia]|uniref:fimbrial biogenesis chaperone n=1 Tax=unclassified Burkholderia TaxID=2613784 RepID=UPI002ABE760A|nr:MULTISPECIES: fimbria/pilus periplasmic chaperone [unclassified Burkholderia]